MDFPFCTLCAFLWLVIISLDKPSFGLQFLVDAIKSLLAGAFEGHILTDSIRLLQPNYPTETLRIFDAKLHGKGLKFGAGKTRDAYAYEWTRKDQFISWSTRLNRDASYQAELIY